MQLTCSVTKDRLLKSLAAHAQTTADFFRQLSQSEYVQRVETSWTAAEQLEHLTLFHSNVRKTLNKDKLKPLPQASHRSYKEIADLYQKKLADAPEQLKNNAFAPLKKTSKSEAIQTYLAEARAIQTSLRDWSEKELDTLEMQTPLLGKLSPREMMYLLMHHDKHHITNIQQSLRGATNGS